MSSDSFYHLLETTPVEDVLPKNQELITIDAGATLPSAFHILAKNNIYSAPVYNKATNEYSGFLDMLDIVSLLVQIFDEQEKQERGGRSAFDNLFKYLEQVEKFDSQHAERVVDFSKRNPMRPLEKNKSVFEALEVFTKTGANRIPITEQNSKVIGVLTLSSVNKWLYRQLPQLGNVKNKTVREMQVGLKEVVTVRKDGAALDAFRLMAKHRINSVAVVDEHGKMYANLSSKDIKVLDQQVLFHILSGTANDFITEVHKKVLKTVAPVMYCTLDTTFGDVVGKMAVTGVHRLYVADAEKKPIGIISLGDVARFLLFNKDQENSQRVIKG